ncbi:MAG: hypothetical protein L6N94_01185 [Candidatus Methylarchaceae archaeon HK01M]|nr:hypothetical protein [Candidatus Methylarchaceae archaeon HK01M]
MKLTFSIITAFLCFFLLVPQNVGAIYRTITVDGDTSDWLGIIPIIKDPDEEPDSTFPDEIDIKEAYVAHDKNNLYFWIQFYGDFTSKDLGFYFSIVLDIDGDTNPDYTLNTDGISFLYEEFNILGPPVDCEGIQVATSGSDIEICLPLNCIGNPRCLNLGFITLGIVLILVVPVDMAPEGFITILDINTFEFGTGILYCLETPSVGGELLSINNLELFAHCLLVLVLVVILTTGIIFNKKFH